MFDFTMLLLTAALVALPVLIVRAALRFLDWASTSDPDRP